VSEVKRIPIRNLTLARDTPRDLRRNRLSFVNDRFSGIASGDPSVSKPQRPLTREAGLRPRSMVIVVEKVELAVTVAAVSAA
jgi:hypothetical protein